MDEVRGTQENRKIVEEAGHVARPAEEVFALITDFEGAGRWMPGVTATRTSTGALGVGSTVEMQEKGEPAYPFEIVAYEPPRLVALRGDTDAGVYTMTWRLTTGEGGTRIDYAYDVDWEAFVAALTKDGRRPDDMKLEAAARKRMRLILDNIKGLLEPDKPDRAET